MTRTHHLALCAVLLLSSGSTLHGADMGFSRHYTGNMVLQRAKPVVICGFAEKGAEVTVAFADQTKKTRADKDGNWSVTLNPMEPSAKGRELKCSSAGGQSVLKNVLVGDVFLFARQTTIDVSLGRDEVGKKAAADVPSVRVMMIRTIPSETPQPDLAKEATSGWAALEQTTALKMSGAAFHLARGLAEKTGVPVGIIDLNMGYHFPIAWLSKEALLETSKVFDGKKTTVEGSIKTVDNMFKTMDKALAEFNDEEKRKEAADKRPDPVPYPREDARFPAAGYNAVLLPCGDWC